MTAVLAFAACAQQTTAPAAAVATVTTAELLNTYWKLTQLGDEVIATPAGARELHLVLESVNQRMHGFAGCNNITGEYVLDGDALKFDQVASTLMACAQPTGPESRFNEMLSQVAHWKITGETLQLLDTDSKPVATFESRYMK
jgi:heat shock protein HslJ